jgi:GntR family transcriptional regulator
VTAVNGDPALWQVVAASIRDDITSGTLKPGETIPPELELAQQWDTSRTTIRRALGALTSEGLLTEGHGRLGRQVRTSKPLIFHAVRSESRGRLAQRQGLGTDAWITDAAEQGRQAGQQITVAIDEAAPQIAAMLELPERAPVVVRRRLRTLDGMPHDRADSYYPADLVDGTPIAHPADIPEGVIAFMAAMGHEQVRFSDELSARMPSPEEARELRIPPGVPMLVQHRIGYTETRPVRVTVMTWPADRVRIVWEFSA